MRLARIASISALALFASAAVACGGGEESTVEFSLEEFAISGPASTPAGSVTFEVLNIGPADPHEFVVVQTDLGPTELPTNPDGSFDEGGEGVEVLGEIEEFPPGQTRSVTFDLEAGSYVLLCNLVEEEEGTTEAHYAEGMRTGFTVE